MWNRTAAPYLLHGFEVSYFTAKVRCALRYKQLWFEECRADIPDIVRRTGLAFIPIVITPEDSTWQDSSAIFDLLEERHPDPPLFPHAPVQRIAAHLIELYTDEFATMPAMHTRWALSEASTRQRFGAMLGSSERGNKAADQMVKGRFSLGADDAAGPVLNAHIRDLLDALSTHLQRHSYMMGDRMSFADCALMGPLHAHFFTDLASREILLETAAPVVGLIERCNAPTRATQSSWQEDGAISASLKALLTVMGRDAVPIILAGIDAVQTWADE
ncbi:MAG: glutathione S-transferase family protein, partial [bacterium]